MKSIGEILAEFGFELSDLSDCSKCHATDCCEAGKRSWAARPCENWTPGPHCGSPTCGEEAKQEMKSPPCILCGERHEIVEVFGQKLCACPMVPRDYLIDCGPFERWDRAIATAEWLDG